VSTGIGASGAGGPSRAEQQRQVATALVHAVYRLVKACSLHADTNQAVVAAATGTVTLVVDLATRAEVDAVSVLFTPNAVFVNGRILKLSRETFALSAELGSMLEACGVTEVTLSKDLAPAELGRFARIVSDAQRDKALGAKLKETQLQGIRLRKVTGFGADGGARREDESPKARTIRTFATAIVVMRDFFEALRRGDRTLPNRVKRVAQKLVAHAEEDSRLLVSLTAAAAAEPGAAGLAVGTTVLAVAMGKQLTADRRILGSIAQAALLYDAGRARLLGEGEGFAQERELSERELDRLPASETHLLTAIGRIHPPAMARNVIAYEALRLRRLPSLGLPYAGRRPTSLAARLVATARAFTELRTFQPGTAGAGIDDAIQMLMSRAEDAAQRTVVKLLVGALGIFPAGTLVELSTGEQAVVLATPALPVDFARPPVRILYDARARLLDEPFELDLAQPPPGSPTRFIKRTIDADETQMKAMRAYVVAAASSRRRPEPSPLSADTARRTYDRNAPTDVMWVARAGEGARSASPAPMSAASASAPRGEPAMARAPRRPQPDPLTPSPRTAPPLTYRSAQSPAAAPRGDGGRAGTRDWPGAGGGQPTVDVLAPLDRGSAPPSAAHAGATPPRQPWAEDDSRRERETDPPAELEPQVAPARGASPAAGIRRPEPPNIYETPTRIGPLDRAGGAPEVEYDGGGATRQASWDEFRDLLDAEQGAAQAATRSPTRPSSLQARIDALGLMDEPAVAPAPPPPSRAARRYAEPEVSAPTRIGAGSAHDLLLAAYLADDPIEDPRAAAAGGTQSAPEARSSRQPGQPVHGLHWGADAEPAGEPVDERDGLSSRRRPKPDER
jgi:hypothetical protein